MLYLAFFMILNVQASGTFPSTTDDITINNTHELGSKKGRVLRGAEPRKKIGELVEAGITDILIFKNETKGEVTKEIAELKKLGYKAANIKWIPFLWKDIDDTVEYCKQAISGLQFILKAAQDKERSVYFHCTVGEDRTGLLAGLYRQYVENWSMKKAYEEELCAWGFASGNPNKPYQVANAVRENLTPVYLMASEVIRLAKAGKTLSPTLCESINQTFEAKMLDKCSASKFAE